MRVGGRVAFGAGDSIVGGRGGGETGGTEGLGIETEDAGGAEAAEEAAVAELVEETPLVGAAFTAHGG